MRPAEGGEERGYDAGKKITGRKRHLAVDTLGMILAVVVHGADWQDQDGAEWVLDKLAEQFRRLKALALAAVAPRTNHPAISGNGNLRRMFLFLRSFVTRVQIHNSVHSSRWRALTSRGFSREMPWGI